MLFFFHVAQNGQPVSDVLAVGFLDGRKVRRRAFGFFSCCHVIYPRSQLRDKGVLKSRPGFCAGHIGWISERAFAIDCDEHAQATLACSLKVDAASSVEATKSLVMNLSMVLIGDAFDESQY